MPHSTALPAIAPSSWRADVQRHLRPGQPAADGGADGDGGVEVAAGDPADGVGHHQHGQAEGEAGGDHVGARSRAPCRRRRTRARTCRAPRPRTSGRPWVPTVAVVRPLCPPCRDLSRDMPWLPRRPAVGSLPSRGPRRSARLLASERVQRDCVPLPRSSTPTPTRRRCWRRTRSCRSSQAYAAQAGVPVETRDISLAGRIIAGVRRPAARGPAHSTTRSPSSARWPSGPRPTSSSCPTSAPPSRS